jgi:hypothetical protein
MIEEVGTLSELREHLADPEGRATLNGRLGEQDTLGT